MIYTFAPFAVPIFLVDVNWHEKENLKTILDESPKREKVFDQTYDVVNNSKIESLKNIVHNSMNMVIEELGVERPKLEITSMWINSYKENQNIHPHNHSNSWYSGVYYPYGSESGPIKFMSPLMNSSTISLKCIKSNRFNQDLAEFNIRTESMLLFPSWLVHYTVPSTSPKISVSFNVWPRGLIGFDDISKVVA